MLLSLLQSVPGTLGGATLIDWGIISGILVLIGGFIIRVIIPGWLHIKSLQAPDGGTTNVRVSGGNGEGEWRGRTSEQLNQQDKMLNGLLSATTAIEKLLAEIARRTEGAEEAIRMVGDITPKVETILAITKRRDRRKT